MGILELLASVASSPWAYGVIAVVAALDAIVPIVPSEATLIAAGVFAGAGELDLALVALAGAAGAFAGDNLSYGLGRLGRGRLPQRPLRKAESLLAVRGGLVILVARFFPGGRTAVTLAAGAAMPHVRFVRLAAAAAAIWASYAALLGYVGGRTFEEEPWKGILAAVALAAALAVVLEAGARLRSRRKRRRGLPEAATCPA